MTFAEKYAYAVNAANLMDDCLHHSAEPLAAAALTDRDDSLGSKLSRAKYANGIPSKEFESGTNGLAQLLRAWTELVAKKGGERRWVTIKAEWDIVAAQALYRRVAQQSLAYWLGGSCGACGGSGVAPGRRVCAACGGSGKAEIEAGRFEAQLIADMVSELIGMVDAHNARANKKLRGMHE